ncbi:tyrosinase family protein [Rivularia sp. PCC 7116]|uniref:tyrosinase family protein n=1 Tax=Rivularia sp. PCC 7116 TaxID=373994 RepID=UPI00029F20AC|nr:tyrosinase family protein [Rivularia sp. PCC 7116]AFY57197.1 tyrosinase family protein [Rivularia sp. PCC 7116]
MQNLKKIKKLSLLAFVLILAITATVVVFSSQWSNSSNNTKTVSQPGSIQDAGPYEMTPMPKASLPAPVYPQAKSDAKLPVRKSIVDLTSQEKAAFVNALKKVKNTIPEGSKLSVFDKLVLQHVMVAGFEKPFKSSGPAAGYNPAHPGHPAFLPWHRQLLDDLENALQKIDPSVTIPYWDWTDPKALDAMLSNDFMGGNGEGVTVDIPGVGTFKGGPVKSGPFADDWTVNEDIHIEPINFTSLGSKIIRFLRIPPFNEYPMPKEVIDRMMNLDDYEIFSLVLEGGGTGLDKNSKIIEDWAVHVVSHAMIGGVVLKDYNKTALPTNQARNLGTMMSILSSPYDPTFWLTHSNVDRLWAEWQDNGHTGEKFYPKNRMDYGYNIKDPIWPWDGGKSTPGNLNDTDLVAMLPKTNRIITAADLLDFRKLGYTYDTTRLRSEKAMLKPKTKSNHSILHWLRKQA